MPASVEVLIPPGEIEIVFALIVLQEILVLEPLVMEDGIAFKREIVGAFVVVALLSAQFPPDWIKLIEDPSLNWTAIVPEP